jgi:hypothetical protein
MPLPKLSNRGAAIGPIGVIKFGTTTGISAFSDFANTLLEEKQLERKAITKAEEVEALRLERIRQAERKTAATNVEKTRRAAEGERNGIQLDPKTNQLSPVFGLNDGTPGAMAQAEAAEASFMASFTIQSKTRLQELALEFSARPDQFLATSTAYIEGTIDNLPEQAKIAAMQEMERIQSLYSTKINEDYANRLKSALGIDLSNIINDEIESAEQLVTIQGSKASLGEIEATKAAIVLRVDQGLRSGSISPEQAEKIYNDFADRIRNANVKYIAHAIYDKGGAEALLKHATELERIGIPEVHEDDVATMVDQFRLIAFEREKNDSYQLAADEAAQTQARNLRAYNFTGLYGEETITGKYTITSDDIKREVLNGTIGWQKGVSMQKERYKYQQSEIKKFATTAEQLILASEIGDDPSKPITKDGEAAIETLFTGLLGDLPPIIQQKMKAFFTDGDPNSINEAKGLGEATANQYIEPWNEEHLDRVTDFIMKYRTIPEIVRKMLSTVTDVDNIQHMTQLINIFKEVRKKTVIQRQIDPLTNGILEKMSSRSGVGGQMDLLQIRDQIVQQMNASKKDNRAMEIFSDNQMDDDALEQIYSTSLRKSADDKRSVLGAIWDVTNIGELLAPDPPKRNSRMDAAWREGTAATLQGYNLAGVTVSDDMEQSASDMALASVERKFFISSFTLDGNEAWEYLPPLAMYPKYDEETWIEAAIEEFNAFQNVTAGDIVDWEEQFENNQVLFRADDKNLNQRGPDGNTIPVSYHIWFHNDLGQLVMLANYKYYPPPFEKSPEGRRQDEYNREVDEQIKAARMDADGSFLPDLIRDANIKAQVAIEQEVDRIWKGWEKLFGEVIEQPLRLIRARDYSRGGDSGTATADNISTIEARIPDNELTGRLKELRDAQLNPTSALTGELGVFRNPHGGESTEMSATVTHPSLNNGRPTNIPLLVKGQSDEAIARILKGQPTSEDEAVAIYRAAVRRAQGQDLPFYPSIAEAEVAAQQRSSGKDEQGAAPEPTPTPQSGTTLSSQISQRQRTYGSTTFYGKVITKKMTHKMLKEYEVGGRTKLKTLTVFWEGAGKKKVLTVGYGHKVLPGDKIWDETIGPNGAFRTLKDGDVITQQMADDWYKQDIANAKKYAKKLAEKWNIGKQPPVVMNILMQMVFQMGIATVGSIEKAPGQKAIKGFKKMFGALAKNPPDYDKAADEMLDSDWATQSGRRARELAAFMRALVK